MKSLIASTAYSRPDPDLWASAVAPAVEARAWVGISTRAVAGALSRALGRALGRRLAAPGVLCYAPLGSRGLLAGALVALLGLHVGWA
jgi:hypothetical protein